MATFVDGLIVLGIIATGVVIPMVISDIICVLDKRFHKEEDDD